MNAVEHINLFLVFLEGILSFFSPCVLPLLPIYVSYLSGGARQTDEAGQVVYRRGKVFLHTLFFVLGISAAFFLLGMSFSALGSFFLSHKQVFIRIGGLVILLLGLVQVGALNLGFLSKERRLDMRLNTSRMNPAVAFVMGFTFSFAWTPCVGPMLSSVLIMASNASSALMGNLLVAVYALGFVIPFLLLGLFTSQLLNFLQKKRNLLRYTIKIGGAILIAIGVMMVVGWMDGFTPPAQGEAAPDPSSQQETPEEGASSEEIPIIPAFDFTLTDQYGQEHTLSDYKGKVVFLNFWASWCGPCRGEMPHIEEVYQDYGLNQEDVVILGVANPGVGGEKDKEGLTAFLEENGYTFPVVFDETGAVFADYMVMSLPTTCMIDKNGNVYAYIPGAMDKEWMVGFIEETLAHTEEEQG